MGIPAGGRLALAGALLVAASCNGDRGQPRAREDHGPDGGGGSVVAGTGGGAARRGEYREVVTVSNEAGGRVLSEQWIAYDLDVPFVDRTIALHIDPETREFTSTATRDNPSLRFIYTAGTVLTQHPRAEASCGTPWVEFPPEHISEVTGVEIDSTVLQSLKPLEILQSTTDPGPPVESDQRGSVYAVPAPGTTGLALSVLVSNPELADRLAAEELTTEVRVPRGGGPVEMTLDLTDVLADVAAATGETDVPDGSATKIALTWQLTAPVDAVATTLPADVATSDGCGPTA